MASTTTSKEEIHSVIKFCALSGQTPTDTLNQITKVYGDNSVCRTIVFDWHKRFRERRTSIEDNERSGRPISKHSEQAVEEVRALLKEDRPYTLKDLALATGFSVWKMHQIVHEDLGMRKVWARWIPGLLTAEQKERRVEIAEDFIRKFERQGDAFLNNIITVDETWVYYYEPESKTQSSIWKHPSSPPPKKARVTKSAMKKMFIFFFDVQGVVLAHGVPQGQTVNAAYYSKNVHSEDKGNMGDGIINPVPGKDPVSVLVEYGHCQEKSVSFDLTSKDEQEFSMVVTLGDMTFEPTVGRNLKEARRMAANLVMTALQKEGVLKLIPEGKVVEILDIQRTAFGRIIGKCGKTIEQVCSEAGAEISLKDHPTNPSLSVCLLTGTMEEASNAKDRVKELLENLECSVNDEIAEITSKVDRKLDMVNGRKNTPSDKMPISALMEYAQSQKVIPSFDLTTLLDTDYKPIFSVKAKLGDRVFETVTGRSISEAKNKAARIVLTALKKEGEYNDHLPETKVVDSNLSEEELTEGEENVQDDRSLTTRTEKIVAGDVLDEEFKDDEEIAPVIEPLRKSRTGKVVAILEKKHSRMCMGHLDIESVLNVAKTRVYFKTLDRRLPNLSISKSGLPKEIVQNPNNLINMLYVARISEWLPTHKIAQGTLVKTLGDHGQLNAETEGMLLESGIDTSEFPEQVLQSLMNLKPWPLSKTELRKRKDLRSSCIFTIDPSTAKDIDDALSIEKTVDGCYRVGVHIADVSHFVKPNSLLDKIASKRSTSYYLVDKVIPMLPSLLSEEWCSLNPDEERLAFSVMWTITSQGKVINQWYGKSVIKSCVKLNYDQAQAFINEPQRKWSRDELPPITKPFGPDDVVDRVNMLHQMATTLRKNRFKQGALNLNQLKIGYSFENGSDRPNGCYVYEYKDSNRLIEEFMLLANMSVAGIVKDKVRHRAVLRNHESPDPKKLAEFKAICTHCGIDMDVSSAGSIQRSLDRYRDEEDFSESKMEALLGLCAKTIKMAKYFCAGVTRDESLYAHYALNVPLYTHFTSPIRRYPDILVHRLLQDTLEKGYNEPWPNAEDIQMLLNHANEKREVSKKVDDRSRNLYFAVFLKTVGPQDVEAMVRKITASGFEVFVPRFGVRNFVSYKELPLERWNASGRDQKAMLVWQSDSEDREHTVQEIAMFTVLNCQLEYCAGHSLWKVVVKPPYGISLIPDVSFQQVDEEDSDTPDEFQSDSDDISTESEDDPVDG